MIKTFKCKETEKIWNEEFSKKLPHDISETCFAEAPNVARSIRS